MRSRFVGEIFKEDCYSLYGTLLDPVRPLNKNLPACSSPSRVLLSDSKGEYSMASVVSVIVGLIIMACAFAGLIVAADECTRHPRSR